MGVAVRVVLVGLVILAVASVARTCNEAVCASLVSKCVLLKSCECNMTDRNNCTCCKDCHRCLAKLYTECCSCVGMCEVSNPKNNAYKQSTVEELSDPIPGLFSVLTEEEDPMLRWTTHNYPAHLDLYYFKPRRHGGSVDLAASNATVEGQRVRHGHHHIVLDPNSEVQNCTVAYMSQCMSLNKCRQSCQSMGAMRYRWFHDYGCCECIGSTCLDYGKGEALCLKCPPASPDDDEEDYTGYDTDSAEEGEQEAEQEEQEDFGELGAENAFAQQQGNFVDESDNNRDTSPEAADPSENAELRQEHNSFGGRTNVGGLDAESSFFSDPVEQTMASDDTNVKMPPEWTKHVGQGKDKPVV